MRVATAASWTPAPIFSLVQGLGGVSQADIEATLNMGVGMALVVPAASVDALMTEATARGLSPWLLGEITAQEAAKAPAVVELVGQHR